MLCCGSRREGSRLKGWEKIVRTFEEVSVDEIDAPREDMRSYMVKEGLEELAESVRKVGVILPLSLRRSGERFEVVDGHRRLEAARLAGLSVVPCVIGDGDDESTEKARLHANIFREDVNAVDEARYMGRLLEKHGYSLADLVRACGKSESYVQGRLAILEFDTELQAAVEVGKISVSVARELARVDEAEERRRLLFYAVECGCTATQARSWRWDYEIARGRRAPVAEAVSPSGTFQQDVRFVTVCPSCKEETDSQSMLSVRFCPQCYGELTREFMKKGGDTGERA